MGLLGLETWAPSTRPRLSLGTHSLSKGSLARHVLPSLRSPGPRTDSSLPAGWLNGLHAVPPAATGGQCVPRNRRGVCACVPVRVPEPPLLRPPKVSQDPPHLSPSTSEPPLLLSPSPSKFPPGLQCLSRWSPASLYLAQQVAPGAWGTDLGGQVWGGREWEGVQGGARGRVLLVEAGDWFAGLA